MRKYNKNYGKKIQNDIQIAIDQMILNIMEMRNHYVEKYDISKTMKWKENGLYQKESK